MADDITYKPLPGAGYFGLLSPTRVYLAGDHLLGISRVAYQERYLRFYLADIQAIIVRRTQRHVAWTIVLSVMLALVLLLVAAEESASPLLVMIPFAIALVANAMSGPTCECYVRTAVGVQRLDSLSRLPALRRFLAAVVPLVNQVQGRIAAEQAASAAAGAPADGALAPDAAGAAPSGPAVDFSVAAPRKRANIIMHLVAFGFAIIAGAFAVGLHKVGLAVEAAEFIIVALAALAMGSQHRTDLSIGMRILTYTVAIVAGAHLYVAVRMTSYPNLLAFSRGLALTYMILSGIGIAMAVGYQLHTRLLARAAAQAGTSGEGGPA